jgi:hypothetical protein
MRSARRIASRIRCDRAVTAATAASHGMRRASECCMRRRTELYGLLGPATASSFPNRPRGVPAVSVGRLLAQTAHPLVRLPFPPEFSVPRRPGCSRPGTSPGLPSLIAASTGGVHNRGRPTARYVPSSTFLTSPTASSSANLCGFVSPRSHVQGSLFRVFPSHPAARARRSPLPSCRCPPLLPNRPFKRGSAPERRARLQGLAPGESPLRHAVV